MVIVGNASGYEMVDSAAGYAIPPNPLGIVLRIQLPKRCNVGRTRPQRSYISSDHALEVKTLTKICLIEPPRVLAQNPTGSFIAMSCHGTTHARARHMTLLLRSGHSLLRTRGHLRVAASARMSLTLVLRLLLLAVERGCERRPLLAVLLLHMWREALMRARGLHHVRTRTWRSSVPVRSCALLGHVLHLRLSVWRHRRIALVLRGHESTGRWVLCHHRRTSSHLRHVRTEAGARRKARTHLVHFKDVLVDVISRG